MNPAEAKQDFISRYPATADLKARARKRIPRFAFEYLTGGCNEDHNLNKNKFEIQQVELNPRYITTSPESDISTELFGHRYSAPFGVAPIGLQGLIWPNSTAILARAAKRHNIPFILSTVTTGSIETIGNITEGRAWFQLYHPAEDHVRDDLLARATSAEYPVLVALADVPSFGYRPRDIRNGLALPPKMNLRNILQIMGKPRWAMNTLRHGTPNFETLKPYMPKNLNLKELGRFMDQTFKGRLDESKLRVLRDKWKGKLVVKGIVNSEDCEKAIRIGVDGIIVSNHGGRQLDAGQSTITPMTKLSKIYGDQIVVMMDSGIRSGPDIARTLAKGASFTFMGRPFMYGVGALGNKGGNHIIAMMKLQLLQIMDQLSCRTISDLPDRLVP